MAILEVFQKAKEQRKKHEMQKINYYDSKRDKQHGSLASTAVGAAIGATVGAIAGVLLAPKTNKEKREELARSAQETDVRGISTASQAGTNEAKKMAPEA